MSRRGLTFGQALDAMKIYNACRRKAWPKDQVVALLTFPNYKPCLTIGRRWEIEDESSQPGWLPSQEDLLANDWEILSMDEY